MLNEPPKKSRGTETLERKPEAFGAITPKKDGTAVLPERGRRPELDAETTGKATNTGTEVLPKKGRAKGQDAEEKSNGTDVLPERKGFSLPKPN